MPQTALSFKSGGSTLEGVLNMPQPQLGLIPAAVLCHPHPLFGGTMDNNVILAVAGALAEAGIATLRFNFRGVPPSEGPPDNDKGVQQDVRSALELIKELPHIDHHRLALAGYSFGAQVILRGLADYRTAKAIALISPPLPTLESPVTKSHKAKMFLVGSADRLVVPGELKEYTQTLNPPTEFFEIPGADHMWQGHEKTVAQHVVRFLSTVL